MSRPDPIQYAERLYSAIRAANFSPMSFLAFGNAVKDGVAMRSMPRIAAEPFMRIVGEMLELEDEIAEGDVIDADTVVEASLAPAENRQAESVSASSGDHLPATDASETTTPASAPAPVAASLTERRRESKKR